MKKATVLDQILLCKIVSDQIIELFQVFLNVEGRYSNKTKTIHNNTNSSHDEWGKAEHFLRSRTRQGCPFS